MSQPPGPVVPSRTLTIASRNAQLHGEWFVGPAPRGIAVVTHGYAEHCGRYREVAHALIGAGAAVLTYDVRGHGRSPGKRGHVDRFATYLDDLDAVMACARREAEGAGLSRARLVLVGHSHGSLIALRALADPARGLDVAAAVLASPFLRLSMPVSPLKRAAGRLMARIYPALAMSNGLRIEDLTSDEGKLAERRADTLCHGDATAGWFQEATAAQEYVASHGSSIRVPTSWLVAGADAIADPNSSRAVAEAIREAPAEYHELAGLKHEVFNERERGRVYSLMADFVVRHL